VPRPTEKIQQIEGEQQSDVRPKAQPVDQLGLRTVPPPYEEFVAYFHEALVESRGPSAGSHLVENFRISTADYFPVRAYSQGHLQVFALAISSKERRKPMLLEHLSPESKSTTRENIHIPDALKARHQTFWCGRPARVVHHRLYFGDEAGREAESPTPRERPSYFVYDGTADRANPSLNITDEHVPDFAKIVFQRT
jgi:hypothetical protein